MAKKNNKTKWAIWEDDAEGAYIKMKKENNLRIWKMVDTKDNTYIVMIPNQEFDHYLKFSTDGIIDVEMNHENFNPFYGVINAQVKGGMFYAVLGFNAELTDERDFEYNCVKNYVEEKYGL